MPFKIGNAVKYSEYALRSKREHWLSRGREPDKSNAKRWLEEASNIRGTVTAILPNSVVEVTTSEGAIHRSLDYLWEIVR